MKQFLFTCFCLASLASCGERKPTGPVNEAYAAISPTKGNTAEGRVNFKVEGGNVRITATITGLKPGPHGFHIHEKGDCSSDDGSSAGGHFNPDNQPHGSPDSEKRHVGDLGNIIADYKGIAVYDRLDKFVKLEGPHSVIGRAIIIHDDVDDMTTQPTGNAGGRIACGVIKADTEL